MGLTGLILSFIFPQVDKAHGEEREGSPGLCCLPFSMMGLCHRGAFLLSCEGLLGAGIRNLPPCWFPLSSHQALLSVL